MSVAAVVSPILIEGPGEPALMAAGSSTDGSGSFVPEARVGFSGTGCFCAAVGTCLFEEGEDFDEGAAGGGVLI